MHTKEHDKKTQGKLSNPVQISGLSSAVIIANRDANQNYSTKNIQLFINIPCKGTSKF